MSLAGWILFHAAQGYTVLVVFLLFCIVIFSGITVLLMYIYGKLTLFSNELYATITQMIEDDSAPVELTYDETLLSRINYHLFRLHEILRTTKNSAYKEKLELQTLISDISHQIKTPLTTLQLSVATLDATLSDSTDTSLFLDEIQNQTQKLEFLLNSLITTSRLETGVIQLKPEYCNVSDTILCALENIIISAAEKDISVIYQSTDIYALCDNKWTAEALLNILNNAVKYTPKTGTITVNIKEVQGYVIISVTDTGIGIPNSELTDIFKRFYRGQLVQSFPGVGIGLYLSRDIIERQNGFIHATSTLNVGSTFEVYLPTI